MGRSIVLTLAREGAKIAVNYRTSKDTAQTMVNHIKSRAGNANDHFIRLESIPGGIYDEEERFPPGY
jgi:NAD(P)-dependent dehydrogenase (short-subunit alcohol dehydrogenase family)